MNLLTIALLAVAHLAVALCAIYVHFQMWKANRTHETGTERDDSTVTEGK